MRRSTVDFRPIQVICRPARERPNSMEPAVRASRNDRAVRSITIDRGATSTPAVRR